MNIRFLYKNLKYEVKKMEKTKIENIETIDTEDRMEEFMDK